MRTSRGRKPLSSFYLLSGATLLSQAAAAAAIPLISRLYSVEAFSTYSIVYSLSAIAGVVSAARLDLAVNAADDEAQAQRVVRSAVLVAMTFALLGLLTVLVLADVLERDPITTPDLYAVPVVAGSLGTVLVCNQMAVREKRFRSVALRTVLQAAALAVCQVSFSRAEWAISGLTAGLLVASLVSVAACGEELVRAFSTPDMRDDFFRFRTLRRYKSFSITLIPQGLINALSVQLPVILSSHVFDERTTGSLGMTVRILSFPLALFALAAGQIYVSQLGEAIRSGSTHIEPLFYATSRRSLLAGVALIAILVPFGPQLFEAVLGSQWRLSGTFAQVMVIGVCAQLVAVPISQTLILLDRKTSVLAWDAARAALIAASFVGAEAWDWNPSQTLTVMSIGVGITYALTWWQSRTTLREHSRKNVTSTTDLG